MNRILPRLSGLLAALILPLAATAAEPDAELIVGKDIYLLRCASCHGGDGLGPEEGGMPKLGPALKGNAFVQNAPFEAIYMVIRKGRGGAARTYDDQYPNMPAFGAEAVPDVRALVAYLKGPLQD